MLTAILLAVGMGAAAATPRTVAPLDRWTSTGPHAGAVTSVVVDPTRPGTVYAATSGPRFFVSGDDGRTWTEITDDFPRDPFPLGLTVDPSSGTLYVWRGACFGSLCYCCSGDIRRRPADGSDWDLVLGVDAAMTSLSVDPDPPTTLYATQSTLLPPPAMRTDENAIQSLDGGHSWKTLGGPTEPRAILPDPTQPFRLYAIDAITGFSVSSDRGDSWVAANDGLSDPFVTTAAVDPLSGSVVFAETPTGVFRTDSGGESWQLTSLHLQATAFAFDTNSPGVVYAGTAAGVFRTADSGMTWTRLSGPEDPGVVSMAIDADHGYLHVGTAAGVFELDLRARSARALGPR